MNRLSDIKAVSYSKPNMSHVFSRTTPQNKINFFPPTIHLTHHLTVIPQYLVDRCTFLAERCVLVS